MSDHFMFSPDDTRTVPLKPEERSEKNVFVKTLYWTETQVNGVKTERYLSREEIAVIRNEILERSQKEGFQITKSAHRAKNGFEGNFIWWYPERAEEYGG